MSSPRVNAFKRPPVPDWAPKIDDVVFVRSGKGLRRITARGTIVAKALHSDSFEVLLKRTIGCCAIKKKLVFFVDDMRPTK